MTGPVSPLPAPNAWVRTTSGGTIIVISDPGRLRLRSIVLHQLAESRRLTAARRAGR